MSRSQKAPPPKDRALSSTKDKGDLFEKEVADVFRLIPRASVSPHQKISGKDVDIYVVLRGPLSSETRIAVDAKDYERPLSRERADREYSSYYPLVSNKHVDQFILVTRNGIVANAKEIFNGKEARHFTIADLQTHVFDPSRLVDDMESQFSSDSLDEYYTDTKCHKLDIMVAFKDYDLHYNEFIGFALSARLTDFDEAKKRWAPLTNYRRSIVNKYTKAAFAQVLQFRNESEKITELEPLIEKWLEDSSLNIGIALLGTYGTGKSCFARRIAHKAALNFKSGRWKRIPLLIELRDFGSHQSIEGLITHVLVNRHGVTNGSFSLFRKMNASGGYFLILDGFDEMKQGMTKDALLYNFNELNSLCQGSARVLLCGRPTMFENEEEQTSLLSGGIKAEIPTRARYIPVEIAPLEPTATINMMTNYVKARESQQLSAFTKRIGDLKAALRRSPEIASLLSRPVHIPMFVTILPEYDGDFTELSRASLYETFINKIIAREVLRLNPAYHHRYSTEQRFRFASALALQMAKMGEVRSIRRSEIPVSVITPFVNQGDTVEIAKRDLVAACFLEQKAPDILSFAHKSFLEFLVARQSLSIIRGEVQGESAASLIYPTWEIASFFTELVSLDDLDSTIETQPDGAWDFILSCLRTLLSSFVEFMALHLDTMPFTHRHLPLRYLPFQPEERVLSILGEVFNPEILKKACKIKWPEKNREEFGLILYAGVLASTYTDPGVRSRFSTIVNSLRNPDSTTEAIMKIIGAGSDLLQDAVVTTQHPFSPRARSRHIRLWRSRYEFEPLKPVLSKTKIEPDSIQ